MASVNLRDWTSEYYIRNQSICEAILHGPDTLEQIPSLNYLAIHDFQDGQLVRFQGMIQDMHNPEYFFETYEVNNMHTGEKSMRCGLYKDMAKCQNNEVIKLNSNENKSAERQTCVVISIPGLNEWAKQKLSQSYIHPKQATVSTVKRTHDKSEESMDTSEPIKKKERTNKNVRQSNDSAQAETHQMMISREHLLNFPIPIKDGKACIVKIYGESTVLKLNQVVDIIGFISLDPMLNDLELIDDIEAQTHNPPAFLVPRLHAIRITQLSGYHQILNPPQILSKAEAIRNDLHMVLSQLLFGDYLAADYLICHLISSIYCRKDYLCLGNFPLNITNFPIDKYPSFPHEFYNILSELIPKSHFFECTLESLNNSSLIPKKDYDCDRLTSGILQLSDNTHLVIDETNLTSGQVSANGKLNYQAISDLLKCQKLTYDFKYYTIEYETDIPVLIMSPVKSFLPCAVQIPLSVDLNTEHLYPEVVQAAKQYFKEENRLDNIRQYLEYIRKTEFHLEDDITDVIQEDFVQLRKSDKSVNADNLHLLMVFSRLMALSYGQNSLTQSCWKRTYAMENERVSRLSRCKE